MHPWLVGREARKVKDANDCMVNMMVGSEAVSERGGHYLMEHPIDAGTEPYASIWCTSEMVEMERRLGSVRRTVDQCMLGCAARKPTCLSSSSQCLSGEAVVCDGSHRHAQAYGRAPGGGYRSKRYQTYPSRFCRWLADIIVTGLLTVSISIKLVNTAKVKMSNSSQR